ncbi:sensor histidine kinase [Paenibacillus sp. GCM10023250]|uniref:sensor histidine kinase n=1 Tax=Paenibacillus sp. GCM10023250 TaxID=3252648 RepID=UPI003623A392
MSRKPWFTIRTQLIATIVASLFASILVVAAFNMFTRSAFKISFTSYEAAKNRIENRLTYLDDELPGRVNRYSLQAAVDEASDGGQVDVYVADESGNVLFRSAGAGKTQLNIIGYFASRPKETGDYEGKPYSRIEAGVWGGKPVYLVAEGRLKGELAYMIRDQPAKNVMLFLLIFIVCFYWFASRKTKKIQLIDRQLAEIAKGNLDVRLSTRGRDELGVVSKNINAMAESLQRQLAKERKLEGSKMALITGVSHDLRTPLTSVVGYLDLLQKRVYADEEERDRFVRNAYSKTLQLKKLIDDLFDYTRLTSGDPQLRLQPLDLAELLRQLIAEYEPIAQERGLNFKPELAADALPLRADSEKLVRAVDNLLMNAMKFSDVPGAIVVRAGTDEWGGTQYIEIENRGTPVTSEQEEQLFDRFYKADAARTAASDGSGLGLSIAKEIIERHGGSLLLKHLDGLFTFRIELPAAPTPGDAD